MGCGDAGDKENLPPQALAITEDTAPFYDDGETVLYEVRLPVVLPLAAPDEGDLQQLRGSQSAPFPRAPFRTAADVAVQVTWTVANLDAEGHSVQILVDPWNEFGRYYPGVQVEDNGDAIPNLSGIDLLRFVPGTKDGEGRSSRINGFFSFDDMEELATDFATVINIIENPPASEEGEEDPRTVLVNYTFNVENRFDDAVSLTEPFLTDDVPALVGFEIGLRTTEPANVAIEFAVELVDYTGDDAIVQEDDDETPRVSRPNMLYTIGAAM